MKDLIQIETKGILEGIVLDGPANVFGDEFTCREPTDDELSAVGKMIPVAKRYLQSRRQFVRVLESTSEIPGKDAFEACDIAARRMGAFVTALRLTSEGELCCRVISANPLGGKSNTKLYPVSYYSSHDQGIRALVGSENPLSLGEKDVKAARDFWSISADLLCNPESVKSLELAVERFNWSYLRHSDADKFIDLMIAMEVILLDPSDSEEVTFKLALRGSLLAIEMADAEERRERFKRLKELYKIRSHVVHGISSKKPRYQLSSQVVVEFRAYVRQCLRRILVLLARKAGSKTDGISSVLQKLDLAALSAATDDDTLFRY